MKKNMLNTRKGLLFSVHCSEVKTVIRRSLPIKMCLLLVIIIAAGLLTFSQAWAKTCDNWVAKVVSVEGIVEAKGDGEVKWQQVQLNETFCAGDMIRVLDNCRSRLCQPAPFKA